MSRVAMTLAWLWHSTSSSAKYALPTFLQRGMGVGEVGRWRGGRRQVPRASGEAGQRADGWRACCAPPDLPVRQDVAQRDRQRHLERHV